MKLLAQLAVEKGINLALRQQLASRDSELFAVRDQLACCKTPQRRPTVVSVATLRRFLEQLTTGAITDRTSIWIPEYRSLISETDEVGIEIGAAELRVDTVGCAHCGSGHRGVSLDNLLVVPGITPTTALSLNQR
jgi:hypothetical protein